jgi:hypothetical protein
MKAEAAQRSTDRVEHESFALTKAARRNVQRCQEQVAAKRAQYQELLGQAQNLEVGQDSGTCANQHRRRRKPLFVKGQAVVNLLLCYAMVNAWISRWQQFWPTGVIWAPT